MSDHLGPLTVQLYAYKDKEGLQVSKMRDCARIMSAEGIFG